MHFQPSHDTTGRYRVLLCCPACHAAEEFSQPARI
jgi:hypothetical protein